MDAADARQRPATVLSQAREALRIRLTRLFFGVAAVLSGSAAAAYAAGVLVTGPAMRGWAVAASAVLAALCAFAALWHRQRPARGTLLPVVWACVLLIAGLSVINGFGIRMVSLGFLPLLASLTIVLGGLRAGLALTAFNVVAIAVVATLQSRGMIPGAETGPLRDALIGHALLAIGGVVSGWLLLRLSDQAFRVAEEREQRFRHLLHIAADYYFELDSELRFTVLEDTSVEHSGPRTALQAHRLGHTPWDLPDVQTSPERLARHRAELQAHRPYNDFIFQRESPRGGKVSMSVSGRPRFAGDGTFLGYWGISRDVTAQMLQQRVLERSEARYRALFDDCPSPLLLHRHGILLDVNPAACALLGLASRGEALGRNLADQIVAESDVVSLLCTSDSGDTPRDEAAPPAELHVGIRRLDGARREVSAVWSSVMLEDGTATITFLHDETERELARRELQHSKALLGHLVHTSPDVITLTELRSGRYEMVNDTFCQVTGYQPQDVIGHTASELGVWDNLGDRDHLVAAIRRDGQVDGLPITFRGKHGQAILLNVSAARFEMNSEEYLVINARDVTRTERVRLEYEAILENVSIGIAYTREHRVVHGNRRCEEMFGYVAGELVGRHASLFWKNESEYAEINQVFGAQLESGRPVETERWLARHDGSPFLCRVQAQAIDTTHPVRGGIIWLFEDVTERRRVEQALEQARDAAEAASRAKSAFLANMNHEIRTPLNGILGFAQLALRPDVQPRQQRDYLQQIRQSAQGLASIITDVLDLAKIEAGKLQVEVVPFSLRESLDALRNTYEPLAAARGLALELQVDDAVPDGVRGDPLRLRQILGNFLSNALKFTDQGRVRMHVHLAGGERVQFDVEDTGPGIAPAVQARLFKPFSQADSSTTRRYGGTGLGLSICRELASLMRGEVGVASKSGVGSRFWVVLPLPRADLSHGGGALAPAPPPAQDHSLTGMRVLVAEDNPVNMMISVAMLENWGVLPAQAGDGEQAVHAVQAAAHGGRPFDAVLMDLQMPGMDGFAATAALRQDFDAATLPIIALTAAALVSEREQGRAVGMTDFVTKPIDADRLHAALRACWHPVAPR